MATQLTGPVMPIKTVRLYSFKDSIDNKHFFFTPMQSDDDKTPESLYFFDETLEPFFLMTALKNIVGGAQNMFGSVSITLTGFCLI